MTTRSPAFRIICLCLWTADQIRGMRLRNRPTDRSRPISPCSSFARIFSVFFTAPTRRARPPPHTIVATRENGRERKMERSRKGFENSGNERSGRKGSGSEIDFAKVSVSKSNTHCFLALSLSKRFYFREVSRTVLTPFSERKMHATIRPLP